MGQSHALIQALQSSNLCLGLENRKKASPLYFQGQLSSERHWPKWQRRAPPFFSAISNRCAQHCSHCLVDQLARPFSHPCMFHMLVFSKRQMQLTGYSDRQTVRACLFQHMMDNLHLRKPKKNSSYNSFSNSQSSNIKQQFAGQADKTAR